MESLTQTADRFMECHRNNDESIYDRMMDRHGADLDSDTDDNIPLPLQHPYTPASGVLGPSTCRVKPPA